MYSTHSILVHVPTAVEEDGKTLSEMSKEELTACVVKHAEKMTDQFFGPVFDTQDLLEAGQYEDYPSPVLFSKDDWDAFKDWLLMCDNAQKRYAAFLCNKIKEKAGTGDISELISESFLTHKRDAEIDDNLRCERWFSPIRWQMKTLIDLMYGTYCFDSEFYDTNSNSALVPYFSELKETADEWALVAFDCHT